MSQIEQSRADLRQSSPDNAGSEARDGYSNATQIIPESPGTHQMNCRAEEKHAMNTARENTIASLIVLANLVPVSHSRPRKPTIANTRRR